MQLLRNRAANPRRWAQQRRPSATRRPAQRIRGSELTAGGPSLSQPTRPPQLPAQHARGSYIPRHEARVASPAFCLPASSRALLALLRRVVAAHRPSTCSLWFRQPPPKHRAPSWTRRSGDGPSASRRGARRGARSSLPLRLDCQSVPRPFPRAAARRRTPPRAVRESLNGKAHSNRTHRLQVDTTHRTRALPRLKQRIA